MKAVRGYRALWRHSAALLLALPICACRHPGDKYGHPASKLTMDGSSTVYPILSALADDFSLSNRQVDLIVDKSGTGTGMRKFSRGEIQVAAASRPISGGEISALQKAGISFIELPFAYDGVSVIVSVENQFANSLKLSDLTSAWKEGSNVRFWSDLNPRWPHRTIEFFGPTDNHGTYDYFADALLSPGAPMRSDVQMNQEYNAIVQAVADNPYALGYVGMSYFQNNRDKVRALAIDAGTGPVSPSQDTVLSGRYRELSRPLLLYVSKEALGKTPALKKFLQFALSAKGREDIGEAQYVGLPDQTLAIVRDRLAKEVEGTVFHNRSPNLTVNELTRLEEGPR